MFDFHTDKARYFDWQYRTARDYVIPFVADYLPAERPLTVLEVGCGEAGVLQAFLERGDRCFGIDLNAERIALAREFHAEALAQGRIDFLTRDIYAIDPARDLPFTFDLILLKDVIEHIPGQERFMRRLRDFLAPGGKVFFSFPPWQMPFGGHQQICQHRVLSVLPYMHLLPRPVYRQLLRAADEPDWVVNELLELKETGISIERFERIVGAAELQILRQRMYLFNPIYQYKFGLRPREQFSLLNQLPGIRNFLTSCAYYLVG